jgi:AcrR family transcriptional regulator
MATDELQERRSLSRERILRAAVDIMDSEGIEAVTMRRIGRELGVEAMSLYNHVEDKAAILAWRDMMRAHPNVIALFAERKHPMSSIDALRPMEFALDLLKRTGLPDDEVVRTFRIFGAYIMGFVLMEQGHMLSGVGGGEQPDADEVAALLDAEQVPSFVSLLPHLVSCDTDENFDFGLELLIAGIGSRIAARSA